MKLRPVRARFKCTAQSSQVCCFLSTDDHAAAEAIDGQEGGYEWGPKGLKPFDLPAPTAGGDVAAVKAGHVSISALRTGFIQPAAKI